ncbi:MAG: hypothetical protein KGL39_53390 [Patescibacteria group bacterium]|nr:hypothetical protein [Patescibacteria group bacterium]
MNKAAQALGRLAKGVPKTLTDEQRKFRAEQLAAARKKRHEKPKRTARRSNGELCHGAASGAPNSNPPASAPLA